MLIAAYSYWQILAAVTAGMGIGVGVILVFIALSMVPDAFGSATLTALLACMWISLCLFVIQAAL